MVYNNTFYHGYAVLLSTFILRFAAMGVYFIGGHFIIPLRVSFGIGAGLAAFFPSIYSSVALLSVVFSGYCQDKLTHRGYTVRPVFLAGSLFVGVGSVGASYSGTFPALLVNSIIMGVGIGFTGFGASGILAPWFIKRSGTFLLLGLSGGGVGGFTYALLFEYVLHVFHKGDVPCTAEAILPEACDEWRPATRYVGIASAAIMLLASMFMRLPQPGEVEAHEALGKDVDLKAACRQADREANGTEPNDNTSRDSENACAEKANSTRRGGLCIESESPPPPPREAPPPLSMGGGIAAMAAAAALKRQQSAVTRAQDQFPTEEDDDDVGNEPTSSTGGDGGMPSGGIAAMAAASSGRVISPNVFTKVMTSNRNIAEEVVDELLDEDEDNNPDSSRRQRRRTTFRNEIIEAWRRTTFRNEIIEAWNLRELPSRHVKCFKLCSIYLCVNISISTTR